MSHPFEVGKRYRNRAGEYIVQAIDGEQMSIRYVGGGTLTTNVYVQARIWENIQFEDQMSREEERLRLAREARQVTRKRTARARRTRVKTGFTGFVATDFEAKKRGIAWSSRQELGTMLAQELSQRTEGDFSQWIVPRKSQVHVARQEYYDQEDRDRSAAFFAAVNEEGVAYGFHVGKPDGKVKAKWPWSALLTALTDDEKVRRGLRAAMKAHELSLDVYAMDMSYGQVGQIVVQERGFLWQHETQEQEITRRMNWQELVEYLQNVAPDKRCDLYLRKRLPVIEALKAGAGVVPHMTDVFEALVPIYDVSIGG